MQSSFELVKNYLLELEFGITQEVESEGIIVIEKEEDGIKNMILDVEEPILIIEQPLFDLKSDDPAILKALLAKNMEIVHGAFALTEDNRVVFRDTLQLENLDLNELESSINSLSLLLSEYYEQIISFAHA